MRPSFKFLAALPLLAAALPAQAALTNGGFEDGLNGWSIYTSAGDEPGFSAVGSVGTPASLAPNGGDVMAVVHAGAVGDYQRLWQDFQVAGNSASMSISVMWNGHDYMPYNDDGYARISQLDSSGNPTGWTTLWSDSIATHVDGTSWTALSYNFASAGSYRIEFGVRNMVDDLEDQSSEVFVDNVALIDPVPEPGQWAMMAAGLGLIGFVGRRRMGSAA